MQDTPARARTWPHVVLALVMASVLAPGLGWRHLWNDEVDTAERARAVLATGLPTVFDPEGRLSTNMAGRELEDGDLHRFTPWAQFYVAALGLVAARAVGASEDTGVRAPFVVLHGACSGLISAGLVAVAGVALGPALAVGAATGLQSVRMVYNRQARYPVLTDVLLLLGMAGIGLAARGNPRGRAALAVALLGQPQVQPLSGLVMGCLLLVMAGVAWLAPGSQIPGGRRRAAKDLALFGVIPFGVSAAGLLLLTRPWLQQAWGTPGALEFRGLDHSSFRWAFLHVALCVVVLAAVRARTRAVALCVVTAALVVLVRLGDTHPMSSARYYMSAVLPLMLWPLALGLGDLAPRVRAAWPWLCVVLLVAPDVDKAVLGAGHLGLRLVRDDARYGEQHVRQPVHQLVDHIQREGRVDDPVLFDMVPQYANWYLRTHPVALLPDLADRTSLNAAHRAWSTPLVMPKWHAWFPTHASGPWSCAGRCDYRAVPLDPANREGPYTLMSGRLGTQVLMCPVVGFATTRLVNAPYEYLTTGVTDPAGMASDVLVLARPCADLQPAPSP